MSSNKTSPNSARGLQTGKTRTTANGSKDGLFGPLVGEPWQEDFSVSLEVVQVERPLERERRLNFGFRVSARTILLALLASVTGYAMYTNDRALIKDVLKIVESHIHIPFAAESPPRQQ